MDLGYFINIIVPVVTFFCIYLIVVAALNLQYGYAGIPNFGIYLSVIGGAIITSVLPGRLLAAFYLSNTNLDFVKNNAAVVSLLNDKLQSDPATAISVLLLTITTSMVMGAFLGFIATFPAIRLKEDYLIMALIAMGETLWTFGVYFEPINGGRQEGVLLPDLFIWLGSPRLSGIAVLIFVSTAAIIVFILLKMITDSPFGRLLKAITDNESTAEHVGKNVTGVKLKVMMLGSAIAALGGTFHSIYLKASIVGAYSRADWSFWPWLMLMVGGMGNNLGVCVGTSIIIIARRLLIQYKDLFTPYLPFDVFYLEPILLAIFLILILFFRSGGILGEEFPVHIRGVSKTEEDVRKNK